MKMARIVVLLSCYIFLTTMIYESQCEMSEEERERDNALFEIFQTAMNRSLVAEEEYEDFLEANGVTIEILEEAIGAKSRHTKEESEDLLETVEKNVIYVEKSIVKQAEQLNELTKQMNEFDARTQERTVDARKQRASQEELLDGLRKKAGALNIPETMKMKIEELEEQVETSAAALEELFENNERKMAKFRMKTMQARYSNENSKDRCEDFKQLAEDLRVVLAKWPGESASLMDKAMNLVKHSHLVKRYSEITSRKMKKTQDEEELGSDDSDEDQLQLNSDIILDSDVTPDDDDVMPGKDEL